METSSHDEYEAKDKIFYTSTLNTWYTIRLERDKQLLTLSVTALGVLITLLRTVGVSRSNQAIFFAIAGFCFCFTIIFILFSLDQSSTYLKKILTNSPADEKMLIILDRLSNTCFVFAMLAVLAIGADSILSDLHKEKSMSQEPEKPQIQKMIVDTTHVCQDGMQGAASLRPKPPSAPQKSPVNSQSVDGGGNQGNQPSNLQIKSD
jgi:hypothetical protein